MLLLLKKALVKFFFGNKIEHARRYLEAHYVGFQIRIVNNITVSKRGWNARVQMLSK